MSINMEQPNREQDATSANWPLRRVGLRVQNMEQSLNYYTKLGLSIIRDERDQNGNGSVGLGSGTQEILQLRTFPGGKPRPSHSAGLYHFALLVANESELGSFILHCVEQKIPLGGSSDHLVSEALYLTDPEGNGIEVYRDRPREEWPLEKGRVTMGTRPLQTQHLMDQAQDFTGFSPRLRLGHMHLNVGNLDETYAFYQKNLGMDLMISIEDQAYFISWDGYHHHLGTNLWAGRNVQPVESDSYGIDFYEIQRTDLAPATLQDPNGITIRII